MSKAVRPATPVKLGGDSNGTSKVEKTSHVNFCRWVKVLKQSAEGVNLHCRYFFIPPAEGSFKGCHGYLCRRQQSIAHSSPPSLQSMSLIGWVSFYNPPPSLPHLCRARSGRTGHSWETIVPPSCQSQASANGGRTNPGAPYEQMCSVTDS